MHMIEEDLDTISIDQEIKSNNLRVIQTDKADTWNIEHIRNNLLPILRKHHDFQSLAERERLGKIFKKIGKGNDEYFRMWDSLLKYNKDSPTDEIGNLTIHPDYDHEKNVAQWESLSLDEIRHNEFLTLLKQYKHQLNTRKNKHGHYTKYFEKIKNMNHVDDANELCDEIREDAKLTNSDKETLSHQMVYHLKTIHVEKNQQHLLFSMHFSKEILPDWLKGWVYCKSDEMFFHTSTREKANASVFDMNYSSYFEDVGIFYVRPSKKACVFWGIQKITSTIYAPQKGELFTRDHRVFGNLFDPESIPAPAKRANPEIVSIVKYHLFNLLGDEKSVSILLSWIAFNAQNIGEKIHWIPIIKGIEGDGKDVITHILKAVVGRSNVGAITHDSLRERFTAWASRYAIGVLNEIKVNDKSILTKLKPIITNEDIEIKERNVDPYQIENHTNYIGFTNHVDCLPLEEHDRRYWVVFSRVHSEKDLEKKGMNDEYFNRLYHIVNYARDQLRKWMLDYPLDADFHAKGRAPKSIDKTIVQEIFKDEKDEIIEAIIQNGDKGVSSSIIHFQSFVSALKKKNLVFSKKILITKIAEMGYKNYPKVIRLSINGISTPTSIWYRPDQFSNQQSAYLVPELQRAYLETLNH